jgi:NinB protein
VTQTVIIRGQSQRDFAKTLIDRAPVDAIVRVSLPGRSLDQNAKFHAMLSDISRAKPLGRVATPETWKALTMHVCGFAVQFELGLNGQPFPYGFKSSKLDKSEMSLLIDWLYQFGAENGVKWSDEMEDE